ncbi:hypothetical protein [Cohnella pontilimi]|uniref:hypothetical protein n=1 Tax=Cohnella pontilimi TaxID=2564100 RepID=UPI001FE2C620|nr:hypothetical protein [Cohnella pontilimi]
MSDELEVDSDVREDRGREALLDESFNNWVTRNIDQQTRQQMDLTDVPNGNVWDSADRVDGGT